MNEINKQLARLSMACVLGLMAVLAWTTMVAADPGVHYVTPDGECGGLTPCYGNIQAAVDAAQNEDVVKIAEGTYSQVYTRDNHTEVVFIDKNLTLQGGYTTTFSGEPEPDTHITRLDAKQQGRGIYIASGISVTLTGLHITGGVGENENGGGGIYGSSSYGSSITATVQNCNIYNNSSGVNGWGGGLKLSGQGLLSHNILTNNQADNSGGGGYVSGDFTLDNNRITANECGWIEIPGNGGGLYVGSGILTNNFIADNHAVGNGGGLVLAGDVMLTNNILVDNQADGYNFIGNTPSSALYVLRGSASLYHNTIAHAIPTDNDGIHVTGLSWGPSFFPGEITMTNTIVSGYDTGLVVAGGCTATLQSILWHDNITNFVGSLITATHIITEDPLFVDPMGGDYHILAGSAAIDAGINASVTTDIDGDPRPQGAGYDIGADEFASGVVHAPLALDLVGPTTGLANTAYTFNAAVNPIATVPITYIWQADRQTTLTHSDAGREDSATFTWTTTGPYTLLVTATNAAGWVTATTSIIIGEVTTPVVTLSKSVNPAPETALYDNDVLTYTIIISAESGSTFKFYDPLDGPVFVDFIERPPGITHTTSPPNSTFYLGGILTGTVTVMSGHLITVSYVARADIPDTTDAPVTLANRACTYPVSGDLDDCTWSNEVVSLIKPRGVELGTPSATVIYHVPLTYTDTVSHLFTISMSGNLWPVIAPPMAGPVAVGESTDFSVSVSVPAARTTVLVDSVGITISTTSAPTKSTWLLLKTRMTAAGVDLMHSFYLPTALRNR